MTPEQLAEAIESVVAMYLDEVRHVVQQAVERSLTPGAMVRDHKAKAAHAALPLAQQTARRTAVALDELREKLHACVCARPGESMAAFADAMGVRALDLQRPMAKLKAEGRVRSVGQRSMMRYFPTVMRAAKSSA